MRTLIILLAVILVGVTTSEARAQEASESFNAEAAAVLKPTPMMVAYGNAAPVEKEKNKLPATPDGKAGLAKDGAGKDVAGKVATGKPDEAGTQAPTAPPQQPVILSAARSNTQSSNVPLQSTGNPAYDDLVMKAAARHGVDPNLIFSVMHQESGFNPRARSYKGASGLMQLMPATARRFGVTNIFDPAQNIDAGARYLRLLLDMFDDDVELALAGYNAGENAVVKSGFRVPRYRETQDYVRIISSRYGSDKHRGNKKTPAGPVKPSAPAAVAFGAGASSRLSNNY